MSTFRWTKDREESSFPSLYNAFLEVARVGTVSHCEAEIYFQEAQSALQLKNVSMELIIIDDNGYWDICLHVFFSI